MPKDFKGRLQTAFWGIQALFGGMSTPPEKAPTPMTSPSASGLKSVVLNARCDTRPIRYTSRLRAALTGTDGFCDLEADADTQTVRVIYDPERTSPEELAAVITARSDFEASVRSSVPL